MKIEISSFSDFNNAVPEFSKYVRDNSGNLLEMSISKADKRDKTLKQLGGLFANWITYISNKTGDSEDYIHRKLKSMFLARIYTQDVVEDLVYGSHKNIQEMWVERLIDLQTDGDFDKLKKHAKRISLSWANLDQMKRYMKAIEQHYQDAGLPLPPMIVK